MCLLLAAVCENVHWIQVNADIKKYQLGSDGAPRLFEVDKTSVGRDISTKAVGSSRRLDLTNEVYRWPHYSIW